MMKGFKKWLADIRGVPAVLLVVLLLGVVLLLPGCVARAQFAGEGALCKPSESRLCNPEPPIQP